MQFLRHAKYLFSSRDFVRNVWLGFDDYEELKDAKGVIRIRKSKERQHNGQKKKVKRIYSDLQNITHRT